MDLYLILAKFSSKEVTLSCNVAILTSAPLRSASKRVTFSYSITALAVALFFFFDDEEAFARAFSSSSLVLASSLSSPWTWTVRKSLSTFDAKRSGAESTNH